MDKAETGSKDQELDPKEIHRAAAETILQEGIDFYVSYEKLNWFAKKGILPKLFPKEKHFVIKPITAGTLIRISKTMTGIELMAKDIEPIIEIICYAITNSESKPPNRLRKFMKRNLTMDEIMQIITFVLKQMNVSDFMYSIILII